MTWLIFALGVVLAVAGAISIASGIPYIQIEWGWTEVIAGTTALSGGILTFALGAVLFRLSALQRAVQRGSFGFPSSNEPDAQPASTPDTSDFPDVAAEAAQPVLEPFDRMAPPTMGEDIEPYLTPAPPDIGADEAAETDPPVGPQAPRRVPWTAKLRARFRKPENRLPTAPDPESEPSLELPPTFDPALTDAGAVPHLDLPGQAPGSSGLLGDDRERSPSEASPRDSSSQIAGFRTRGADNESPFHHVGIDDVATAATVVGRYEAGGASYVLFSDGAIEVETGTGLHRFGSMQELRAFIEAQEQQGSGQDR